MSAGGDIVTLDKPGDEHLAERVVKRRGDEDAVSPVTVEEMVDLVGQHGLTPEHIATLLDPWVEVMGYPQGVTA